MSFLTLKEIESKVSEVAKRINAPEIYLPTYGSSEDGARPHIELRANGYQYVVVERGEEYKRDVTMDFKELLFWIFESVTFTMASDWELANRKPNEDSRRQLFAKQIELMTIIDKEFGEKTEKSLRKYSFSDN